MTDKSTAKTATVVDAPKGKRGRKPLDPSTLASTEPNSVHKSMAEWFTQASGVEVTPKAVQVVTALQSQFRRSEIGAQVASLREADKVARAKAKRAAQIAAAEKRLANLKATESATTE